MTDNTTPAWFALMRCGEGHISYDEGDGRKERCREHVGAGNRCGAEREVVRVIEIDPLLRWLDEQAKATMDEHRNFRSDYDEGRFDAFGAVEACIEGRDTPMTDNTAPERVTLYVCPSCGGGINYEPKGSNLSCDCPDGLDEYPACDKPVEYVALPGLLAWLDEQIRSEREWGGIAGNAAAYAYEDVKAHIEGRDTDEVVLRLTREEAKWTAACLEPHSHNEHERAASRKLRAALDQEE